MDGLPNPPVDRYEWDLNIYTDLGDGFYATRTDNLAHEVRHHLVDINPGKPGGGKLAL